MLGKVELPSTSGSSNTLSSNKLIGWGRGGGGGNSGLLPPLLHKNSNKSDNKKMKIIVNFVCYNCLSFSPIELTNLLSVAWVIPRSAPTNTKYGKNTRKKKEELYQ